MCDTLHSCGGIHVFFSPFVSLFVVSVGGKEKRHSPTGHPVELPDPRKMSVVPSWLGVDFCGWFGSHKVDDVCCCSSSDVTTAPTADDDDVDHMTKAAVAAAVPAANAVPCGIPFGAFDANARLRLDVHAVILAIGCRSGLLLHNIPIK